MDFVNFAAVEFVGAIEAQRSFERGQRKWLRAWRQLEQSDVTETPAPRLLEVSAPPVANAKKKAA